MLLFAACDTSSVDGNTRSVVAGAENNRIHHASSGPPQPVGSAERALTLSGEVGAAAIAAVRAEADRQQMGEVAITRAQSFRIVQGKGDVATLVTGEGNMAGARNAGCFVAIVQGDDTALIPTLGDGDNEAQTCSGPRAVGLLSTGVPISFGFVFSGATPNAQGFEPIVVNWNRRDNTLMIDEALSARASQAGAQTIAAIKKLL